MKSKVITKLTQNVILRVCGWQGRGEVSFNIHMFYVVGPSKYNWNKKLGSLLGTRQLELMSE